jgi:hypothetical protein
MQTAASDRERRFIKILLDDQFFRNGGGLFAGWNSECLNQSRSRDHAERLKPKETSPARSPIVRGDKHAERTRVYSALRD